MSTKGPVLYIVATPIGNLDDISYRAVATLKGVDIVFAEDTRVSRRLFDRYGIGTKLEPFHDHNEQAAARRVVARIKSADLACALISDAGTPLVSDPGFVLVREAIANEIPIYAIPGACAAVAALCVSGLAIDRFAFEGFLPARHDARVKRLQELVCEQRTLILYESPRRIEATLGDISNVFGGRRDIVVTRELTKLHETQYRGAVDEVVAAVAADPNAARGEIVILIAGSTQPDPDTTNGRRILSILLSRLSTQQAVETAVAITGVARNTLYKLALELKDESQRSSA